MSDVFISLTSGKEMLTFCGFVFHIKRTKERKCLMRMYFYKKDFVLVGFDQ